MSEFSQEEKHPDAFHPGAGSDCLLFVKSQPEHLAAHPCFLPAPVHRVLYSSLCLQGSKGPAENSEEFGIRMGHEPCFREGFCIQRMFVKIECIERIANSLEVKLSMQKISVASASEKNYQCLSNVILLISLPHTNLAAPGCAPITFPS